MTEYGEQLNENTVRFQRLLPGPIERVWAYLTESDKRAEWLCAGDAEVCVGGHVDMHFHNASLSGDDDIPRPEKYRDMPERVSFVGKVTRCEQKAFNKNGVNPGIERLVKGSIGRAFGKDRLDQRTE